VDVLATSGRRSGAGEGLRARKLDGISGSVWEAASAGACDLTPPAGAPQPGLLRRGLHHFAAVHSPRWLALAREFLSELRPDVLHTNTIVGMSPAVWRAARDTGVPVVHTLRDYHLLCPRTTLVRSSGEECGAAPLPCRILRGAKRAVTVGVAAVTAPSRFVLQRHLDHGFFADAIAEVVPNAHAGPLPAPVEPTGAEGGPLQGLFLGQIDAHKGVPPLLAALEELFDAPQLAELSFAFAGRGPLEEEVRAFCARHPGRATYHGMVQGEPKERLLAGSAFLVLPSIWNDNFPRTMLEAFAHAMPVIGARRGGIPEVVQHGISGQIVEPAAAEVAAAIRRYVEDRALLARHGRQGRRRAEDYTMERQVEAFLDLYERVGA
jgi:glycosyltransferase involved in cell wall biosynthesis